MNLYILIDQINLKAEKKFACRLQYLAKNLEKYGIEKSHVQIYFPQQLY